jgi:hypothetical protein
MPFRPPLRMMHPYLIRLGVAVAVAASACVASAAQVCVTMGNGGGRVAGIQVDITWDSACMTATAGRASSAGCAANPATRKQVSSRILSPASLRAMFLALDNVDPIADGQLFCCAFSEPKAGCCGLQLSRLIASDPSGTRINDPNVTFEATLDGVPCAVLGVGGGTSRAPAARAPLRRDEPATTAELGTTDTQARVPAEQPPAPADPAGAVPAAPATPARPEPEPREAGAEVGEAARPEAGVPGAEAVAQAPELAEAAPQATPAAATPTTPTPEAAADETPAPRSPTVEAAPAAATATVAVTQTPTQALPTFTPTRGGFLSGCQSRRQ